MKFELLGDVVIDEKLHEDLWSCDDVILRSLARSDDRAVVFAATNLSGEVEARRVEDSDERDAESGKDAEGARREVFKVLLR